MTIWKHQKTKSSLHKLCNNHWVIARIKIFGSFRKKILSTLQSIMIILYNNPLCIFHKRPNLWWHYWQLTVASVLWFIPLCISFINQDLLKRHSWELELEFWSWPHKGVHWSSVHCLKKSWLRFSARPSLPPPSLDCFMSRRLWKTQIHCCTCRWFGHWSPQPRCQRTEHSWNLFVIFSVSKLLIIMFTNNNFKTFAYHVY